ncbi:MAG: hypothetical protein ABSA83_16945 [Verrucomicrobiota bacterium]|jgi:hypothetical protein
MEAVESGMKANDFNVIISIGLPQNPGVCPVDTGIRNLFFTR